MCIYIYTHIIHRYVHVYIHVTWTDTWETLTSRALHRKSASRGSRGRPCSGRPGPCAAASRGRSSLQRPRDWAEAAYTYIYIYVIRNNKYIYIYTHTHIWLFFFVCFGVSGALLGPTGF